MRAAGVPLVPGSDGTAGLEELRRTAAEAGFPVLRQGRGGRRREGDAPRRVRGRARARVRGGERRGGGGVRRRLRVRREARLARASRRDPGALRRRRRRAHARRARVLDPAPAPEARRGVAVGRPRRDDARGDGGDRRAGVPRDRLPQRRHVRVPRRPRRRVLLHRGELPAPGRAPRLGAGDGHRHRARADPASRRASRCRRQAVRRGEATRSRSGSTPRIPRAGSSPRRGRSRASTSRSAPACGSTRRFAPDPRSRRTTTR